MIVFIECPCGVVEKIDIDEDEYNALQDGEEIDPKADSRDIECIFLKSCKSCCSNLNSPTGWLEDLDHHFTDLSPTA